MKVEAIIMRIMRIDISLISLVSYLTGQLFIKIRTLRLFNLYRLTPNIQRSIEL